MESESENEFCLDDSDLEDVDMGFSSSDSDDSDTHDSNNKHFDEPSEELIGDDDGPEFLLDTSDSNEFEDEEELFKLLRDIEARQTPDFAPGDLSPLWKDGLSSDENNECYDGFDDEKQAEMSD